MIQATFIGQQVHCEEGELRGKTVQVTWLDPNLLVLFQSKSDKSGMIGLKAKLPPGYELEDFLVAQKVTHHGRWLALVPQKATHPVLEWCQTVGVEKAEMVALKEPRSEREIQTLGPVSWFVETASNQLTRLVPFNTGDPPDLSWSQITPRSSDGGPMLFQWPLAALDADAEKRRNRKWLTRAALVSAAALILGGACSHTLLHWSGRRLEALQVQAAIHETQIWRLDQNVEELEGLLGQLETLGRKRQQSGALANLLRGLFNLAPGSILVNSWQIDPSGQGWRMVWQGQALDEQVPSQWLAAIEETYPGYRGLVKEVRRNSRPEQELQYEFTLELVPGHEGIHPD